MAQVGSGKGRGDIFAALRKVRPTLKVQGNDRGARECASCCDGFHRGHGQVKWADLGDAGCAEIENCRSNGETPADLSHMLIPHRVTGKVDAVLWIVGKM